MRRGLLFIAIVATVLSGTVVGYYLLNQDENLTAYQLYARKKIKEKKNGKVKTDSPEMFGIIARQLRTKLGDDGPNYGPNQIMDEYLKAKAVNARARMAQSSFDFIERGPGNVAGRTRGLLIDPEDTTGQTWYAGSASGGIWKTEDGGENWAYISGDIPNLATNTLAMSPANPSVIYAGTGEHFVDDVDGSGLFKSSDKGVSWTQVVNPNDFPDFKNVSRIVVDPNDENTVIATTRNTLWARGSLEAAIYKTTDGGDTWTRLRSSTSERYDDIDFMPGNFNTLLVAIDGVGVIKSTDGGTTWTSTQGISPSGRVEITISTVNPNRAWASVQGGVSGSGSDLYVSSNGGDTWSIAINSNGSANEHFLGGQGWYDNIITTHPFNEDIVYVGGVNTFKFELTGTAGTRFITVGNIEQDNTGSFLSFVDFNGAFLGGGMDVGDNFDSENLLPIEIRFGQGTQKAHRFTVAGRGSGVDYADYTYQDYVDVPFTVWDTENNVQLMASFRDQQEDGAWNLIERNTSGNSADHSREYLFVHNIPYAEEADANIGRNNGGVAQNQMYFFWPILTSGGTFDANNLPLSNLIVNTSILDGIGRQTTVVSDAYGEFNGVNSFPQSTRTAGLHPDQHNILIGDIDSTSQTFRLYIGNDGGVYESVQSTDPGPNNGDFNYVSYGYNTTQFYGADKAPGEYRFIGGMQDNGTWYHEPGTEGGANVFARFGIGGDGFESLWHSEDINKLIGGSQFNGLAKTINGGSSWINASSGLPRGSGSAPFITRLAHHKSRPDLVFAIGSDGVYRSENFGDSWSAARMNDANLWAFSSSTDVEVSYANPDIVWAGTFLSENGRPHVSTDGGRNFNAANNYTETNMGSSAGIGTHPYRDSTAFMLFSFSSEPKVLKTDDLGQTWTDISGFDGTGDRGFPDVAINCLFVFPSNEDQIWVGSEIGIIETKDGGESWNLMENNMPAVNVYDFKLVEETLVIATYGRGIWSVDIDLPSAPQLSTVTTAPNGQMTFNLTYEDAFESTEIYVDGELLATLGANELGEIDAVIQNSGFEGLVEIEIISYFNGNPFSETYEVFLLNPNQTANSFGTTFDADGEFIGRGLEVGRRSGLSSRAMHSRHPYEDNTEYFMYLKTPITVGNANSTFYYQDIAIVAEDSYVVVEGSTDGVNWVALEDPYNVSLHDDWEVTSDVSAALLKDHSVDLTTKFASGDVILVRFRLVSGNSTAYGWAVDNLFIQEEALLSIRQLESVRIYPTLINPAEVVNIVAEGLEFDLFTIEGRKLNVTFEKKDELTQLQTQGLESGVYVIQSNNDESFKFIVR